MSVPMYRRLAFVLLAALFLLCVACGPRRASRPSEYETGAFRAKVTDKYDCFGIGWDDRRCRPYQRPEDPEYRFVRLLFSYELACPVNDEDMIMTAVHSDFTCRWRVARP